MTEKIDRSVFAALSESLGDDFVEELIDTFMDEVPGLFQEMQQALSAGDADKFRRAAHSLKSSARTFGAMELAEKAQELEYMARENNLDVDDRLEVLDDMYQQAIATLRSLK